MIRIRLIRHAGLALIAALGVYAIGFYGIESWRTYRGPWQVQFVNTPNGTLSVHIDQPHLGISNVQISFVGQRLPGAGTHVVSFVQARPVPFDVPFGECIFLDTMSLPGTVVLQLLGHEVQLMPRVLTIDKHERPWRSGETIELNPAIPDGNRS